MYNKAALCFMVILVIFLHVQLVFSWEIWKKRILPEWWRIVDFAKACPLQNTDFTAFILSLRALLLQGQSLRCSVDLLILSRIRFVHRKTAREQQTLSGYWMVPSSLICLCYLSTTFTLSWIFSPALFINTSCCSFFITQLCVSLLALYFHLSPFFPADEWFAANWKRVLV